ncbi:MAG: hypothetical protein HOP17_07345 [Acidobacteria bacterium]|nr:hypothetical protein [Acidobacteriota bacterium]
MTRRHFWQIPEFIKFRTVFENADTVLGVNDRGEHKLFRKDTGSISFDERAALGKRLIRLAKRKSVTRVVRLVPRLFPQPV